MARVSSTVVVIAVPSSLNVNSLKDLISMVRAQPGKTNWASITGVTDLVAIDEQAGHLAAFAKALGIQPKN